MDREGIRFQSGLSLRPMMDGDRPFIETLYRSTREDLLGLDAEEEFIEELIEFQRRAQREGLGGRYPNAMDFIVEYQHERIGRVVLDFGHNEVRVVSIALIAAARGRGFGAQVVQAVQQTAARIMAPVALTLRIDQQRARQLFLGLGFCVAETHPPFERLVWHPPASGIIVGA